MEMKGHVKPCGVNKAKQACHTESCMCKAINKCAGP